MNVTDFEGWLHKTASGMTSNEADHQDLVQEGRIEIWKALERADEGQATIAGYVTVAAKGRMLDIVSGRRRQVGHTAPEGKVVTNDRGREARAKIRAYLAHHPAASGADIARATGLSQGTVSVQRKKLGEDTEIDAPGSLDALKDAGYDAAGRDEALIDMIVQAYMYGQIRQALDVLTPNERRYVELRFWEGYQGSELKAAFGYDPGAIWSSAKRRLRPVLEEMLAVA